MNHVLIDLEHCFVVQIYLCLSESILLDLQPVGDQVTSKLLESDEVLNYVFTLLASQKTFVNSCQLIEDMLQSRKDVLDLHRIREY